MRVRSVLLLMILAPLAGLPAETLSFSGYSWQVKASDRPVGPGPNHFSADAVVSSEGAAELAVRKSRGRWLSAEMFSQDTFGYGSFVLTFRMHRQLDSQAVFGFFLYDAAMPPTYGEIDFEIARWGVPEAENAHFTVQPYQTEENALSFFIQPSAEEYTAVMEWLPGRIAFTLSNTAENVYQYWVYTGPDIPKPSESRVHLNLWLFKGKRPQGDGSLSVTVTGFRYEPKN